MNQWGLKTLQRLSLGILENMKDGAGKGPVGHYIDGP